MMRAWGGEHEARYKDEMTLLKMVTAKEHAQASGYCQLVRLVEGGADLDPKI